jgi:chromosome segregation ATPase
MKTRFPGFAPTRAWWFFLLAFPALLFAADADIAALRAKAEKGNAVAQYNLGLAYTTGESVPKDTIEAYVWLRLATENGATGKALGILMDEMSPSELAAGKLRLDERRSEVSAPAPSDRGTPAALPAEVSPTVSVALAPVTPAPAKETAAPVADSSTALKKELMALRDNNAKLRQEIALAQRDLDNAKAAAAVERGKLETAAANRTQKLAALTTELEAARKKLAAAQSAPAKEEAVPVVNSSAALEKALADLRDDKVRLNLDIAEARKELDTVKAAATEERGKLEATVADQTQKLAALSAELETVRKGLAAAQSAPAKETVVPVVDPSAALQKELTALRDDNGKLSQEIALARKEVDNAKAAATEERGKLEVTVTDRTQKLAALSAELETVRKGLAAAQSAPADSARLQEKVTKLTQQLAAAQTGQTQGSKLAAELDTARKDLTSAQKTMADSAARLQKLTDGQKEINRQLAETQAVVEHLKRDNADLQAERTSLTARLAQPLPAAASTAATVTPASAISTDDVARLKSDLARAEQTVEMTVRSFALMRQENERLKAQLEQAGAKVTPP